MRRTSCICRALRAQIFLGAMLIGSLRGLAQPDLSIQQAERELNSSYQEAMRALAPADREKLRKAERAWVTFAEKNLIAMRIAAQSLGIPVTLCEEVQAKELFQRSADFYYSKTGLPPENNSVDVSKIDNDLNKVYQRCIGLLSDKAKAALRDAQRAWVEYRDANRPFGYEFISGLTSRRADQLTDFYISGTVSLSGPSIPPKAGPSPPDPFERAR